jgi:dienelactone hydrolase
VVRGALGLVVLAVVATACTAPHAPAAPTSAGPGVAAPTTLTAIAAPAGATARPDGEWYWAPGPNGRIVTISVFRPDVVALDAPSQATTTVVILHGGDGFRRMYEDLARRYAAQGFIAVTGCWFQASGPPPNADEINCEQAPTWKGMNSTSVADADALVTAAKEVPGVDPSRLVVAGHSYGAGVALLRAAVGHDEPVVASSGFLAPAPLGTAVPLPTDQFATEHAAQIHAPVLIVHAATGYDFITPPGQAWALFNALGAAGHPATLDYLAAPAGHAFPWQAPFDSQYLTAATNWIHNHVP